MLFDIVKVDEKRYQSSIVYTEEVQDNDTKYTIVNEDDDGYYTIQPFFKCRDFINESLLSVIYQCIPNTVYKFKCNEIWKSESGKYFNLAVHFGNNDELVKFKKFYKLINNLEDNVGIPRTSIRRFYRRPNKFLITLSSEWLISTQTLSFYTLLYRIITNRHLNLNQNYPDIKEMIRVILNATGNYFERDLYDNVYSINFEEVIRDREENFKHFLWNYPKYENLVASYGETNFHHRAGISTYSKYIRDLYTESTSHYIFMKDILGK